MSISYSFPNHSHIPERWMKAPIAVHAGQPQLTCRTWYLRDEQYMSLLLNTLYRLLHFPRIVILTSQGNAKSGMPMAYHSTRRSIQLKKPRGSQEDVKLVFF